MTKVLKTAQPQRGTVFVSDEDYDRLCNYRWQIDGDGYAKRNASRDEQREGSTAVISLAREVLRLPKRCRVPGQPLLFADHIDGDPMNNVRENLRAVTPSENKQNSASYARRKKRSSNYRGVSRLSPNRWRARAKWDGVDHHLGSFPTEIEAAYAAQQARLMHQVATNEDRHPISLAELEVAMVQRHVDGLAS